MSLGADIAIAFAVGVVVGWLLCFLRRRPPDGRLEEELRQQAQARERELADLREQLTQSTAALAAAEANQNAANRLLEESRSTYAESLRSAKEAQDKALADLRETFKALSADALKQSAPQFLQLANETLAKFQETAKGDLATRQEAIATLVQPLKEQLETYQRRLQQSETAQAAVLGEVKKQLEGLAQNSQTLSSETLQLRKVLSSNQARGRWGEETLRRVVEAAGMSPHCDFSEQTQSDDKKPDLLVHLPGNRIIIVDAKVPDLDFLHALDAADPAARAQALSLHAAKLKDTIKDLAKKDYPAQFPGALDYVVLFLPAESLFSAALEADRDLILWAAQRQIMLATPASLDRAAAGRERQLAAARPDGKRARDRRGRPGAVQPRGHLHRALRENPRRPGESQRGLQRRRRQLRADGAPQRRKVAQAGRRRLHQGTAGDRPSGPHAAFALRLSGSAKCSVEHARPRGFQSAPWPNACHCCNDQYWQIMRQ